jgi:hypothetical protein
MCVTSYLAGKNPALRMPKSPDGIDPIGIK